MTPVIFAPGASSGGFRRASSRLNRPDGTDQAMSERESREQEPRERASVDRVALLLDADLESEERLRLLAAVEADAELRQHYREISAVWEMLDAYPAIDPISCVSEQVLEQARSELTREHTSRLVRIAVGWVAAAAIFLTVFLGLPAERPGANNLAHSGQDSLVEDGAYARSFDWDFEDF